MQKILMSIFIIIQILNNNSFSQWKNQKINNGFDEEFNTSTTASNNNCYLRLFSIKETDDGYYEVDTVYFEKQTDTIIKYNYSLDYSSGYYDTLIKDTNVRIVKNKWIPMYKISLDLVGNYFCDDEIDVNIVLIVNGQEKKYFVKGKTYSNNKGIELMQIKLTNPEEPEFKTFNEFVIDFQNASIIKVRVLDNICDTKYFEFSMKGSKSAIDYVIKKS